MYSISYDDRLNQHAEYVLMLDKASVDVILLKRWCASHPLIHPVVGTNRSENENMIVTRGYIEFCVFPSFIFKKKKWNSDMG